MAIRKRPARGQTKRRAWGRNLLDRQHPEFVTTNSLNEQVHRSGALKPTWLP